MAFMKHKICHMNRLRWKYNVIRKEKRKGKEIVNVVE